MPNQAAWIKEKYAKLVVDDADMPTPGAGELLVKVNVIGFSPVEWKMQTIDLHGIPHPNVLGNSYSGVVESVGPDVTKFQPGDRVAVNISAGFGKPEYGAYQRYAVATAASSCKLPESVTLEAGATTIMNLAAVASALSLHMKFDRPALDGSKPTPKNQKAFIYGGSSSCGGLAINYLTAAGYEVVTTSSPQHKSYVQSLNPSMTVLDHTLPQSDLLEQIRANGPYIAIFDTISIEPTTKLFVEYLTNLPEGGEYWTVQPQMGPGPHTAIPDNVKRSFAGYTYAFSLPENQEYARWFFEELVPKGLESGIIKPTRAQWLQGGLEKCQEALDMMRENRVSGRKLVLDPWA